MKTIELYSKYGNLLDFNRFAPLKRGARSDIYRSVKEGKPGLRVYHQTNPIVKTINEDHFKAIKDIEHEALPKLNRVFYQTSEKTPFDPVMAYTCDIVEEEALDLTDKDVFTDKVVGRILSAGTALAEKGYSLSTPQSGDIVLGKDGAYLVDPNKFIKEKNLSTEELIRINHLVALKYIKLAILNNYRAAAKQDKEGLIIVSSIPELEKTLEYVNKMSA